VAESLDRRGGWWTESARKQCLAVFLIKSVIKSRGRPPGHAALLLADEIGTGRVVQGQSRKKRRPSRSRGQGQEFMLKKPSVPLSAIGSSITTAVTALLFLIPRESYAADYTAREKVGIVPPSPVTEFLRIPEDIQTAYVGGIMEGMAFVSYGNSEVSYPAWVNCVRSRALGDTTKDVVSFIQQEPNFGEGMSSTLSQTLGRHCKH
jgi:hypothetical protein